MRVARDHFKCKKIYREEVKDTLSKILDFFFIFRMVGITLPDVMVSGSVFALSSLFGVTSVLTGSVLFNAVYSATIGWYRGFTFMFGALLYTIPITISV